MTPNSFQDLHNIIDQATDAIEFKLVIASLIAKLGKLSYDSSYHLRKVLSNLIYEFDSEMSIDLARRKSRAAITAVSSALQ